MIKTTQSQLLLEAISVCLSFIILMNLLISFYCQVLHQDEFSGDFALLDQLETAKLDLRSHFNAKYTSPHDTPRSILSSTPSSSMLSVTSDSSRSLSNSLGSPQKNFMARFQCRRAPADELSEFWNLPQEDFECDPVQWWYGRRAQFPNLYRLARDILSIPGMYSNL